MYQTTTNSTTSKPVIFRASNGQKFQVPNTIPNLEERMLIEQRWLPEGTSTARGIFAMGLKDLLAGVVSDAPEGMDIWEPENADEAFTLRCQEWETLERAFEAEYNRTWAEEIVIMLAPASANGVSFASDAEVALVQELRQWWFPMVPVAKHNELLFGACSSRRAGVPLKTWADRTLAAGYYPGLVGLIAQRAWSMPVEQLTR